MKKEIKDDDVCMLELIEGNFLTTFYKNIRDLELEPNGVLLGTQKFKLVGFDDVEGIDVRIDKVLGVFDVKKIN